MKSFSKYDIATAIAVLFHLIGFAGILFYDRHLFAKATFYNLLLMFILLLYTHTGINRQFILFLIITVVTGIGVEIIGTSTGWLFGSYSYGEVLGPAVMDVPLIIGINWFMIIYCCGITIYTVFTRLMDRVAIENGKPGRAMRTATIVIDGALLAVLFDWLMEPVAINLGYWQWYGGEGIPFFNYLSWFLVSSVLLAVFQLLSFNKKNKFAVNLLLIQMMFFLLLRTIL